MLLTNATYMDPEVRFREADIRIEGGAIRSISPVGSETAPADSFDCSGLLVLPGLVKATSTARPTAGAARSRVAPSRSGAAGRRSRGGSSGPTSGCSTRTSRTRK